MLRYTLLISSEMKTTYGLCKIRFEGADPGAGTLRSLWPTFFSPLSIGRSITPSAIRVSRVPYFGQRILIIAYDELDPIHWSFRVLDEAVQCSSAWCLAYDIPAGVISRMLGA